MRFASQKWQVFLLLLLLLLAIGLVSYYGILLVAGLQYDAFSEAVLFVVVMSVMITLPLSSLALANLKVSKIKSIFTGACPGDLLVQFSMHSLVSLLCFFLHYCALSCFIAVLLPPNLSCIFACVLMQSLKVVESSI